MRGAPRLWRKICRASRAPSWQLTLTLQSALSASGEAQPGAAEEDGAVLAQGRQDKEPTYPELLTSRRCRLVVVAIETGGRWTDEVEDFLWQLALAKAREVPALLTHSAALAWERRWFGKSRTGGSGTSLCRNKAENKDGVSHE